MNYQQTLDYMFSQLPMYQRQGVAAFKKDIGNILHLCSFLGNPQANFKCIHIAGTNGKGSVTHMLGSVLVEYGYRVGLYTSPHYKDFRERIKVNDEFISKQDVVAFIEKIKPILKDIPASFFEMTVAMAFYYFSKQDVDFAIIETGLGGRLDSTNIVDPIISIITNISFDHESMLGNTLQKIAFEKAGIIKSKTPVVIGEKRKETYQVFESKAANCKSKIHFAENLLSIEPNYEYSARGVFHLRLRDKRRLDIEMEFPGPYQKDNVRTSIASLAILCESEFLEWNRGKIERAFLKLKQNVKFIGRWEKLGDDPLIIADSAHNEAGISSVIARLQSMPDPQIHFVLGFVKDKSLEKILNLFPRDAHYYFSAAKIPRALSGHQLKSEASKYGLKGRAYVSIRNALKAAKRKASSEDLIYVGGSIFVVAEVL